MLFINFFIINKILSNKISFFLVNSGVDEIAFSLKDSKSLKNCCELFVPNELQDKPTPVKLQFGIVDYVTKDWMKKKIKKGEMIMRTCKKEKTLSGKETFKWRNNALESIPFGETFDVYIEHIKSKVNGPNA